MLCQDCNAKRISRKLELLRLNKLKGELTGSWKDVLGAELEQPYMQELRSFLQAEKQQGKTIYPEGSLIFNAFNTTPFEQVKVVIIGQDPYHGPNQAHGLSFSVRQGVTPPPSLVNIFKELESDLGVTLSGDGDLTPWAQQGVLLLNATLTVEQAKAGSHQNRGWEQFTDKTIETLNNHRDGLVFILWGSYAQKKGKKIDSSKHFVLKSVHPSPLSSYRGFFGSKPFSQVNEYLIKKGEQPIDWRI